LGWRGPHSSGASWTVVTTTGSSPGVVSAIRELMAQLDQGVSAPATVVELDLDTGYETWAPTYDTIANALIRAEEPLVAEAVRDVAPGRALDAACGTGRHAATLVALGTAPSASTVQRRTSTAGTAARQSVGPAYPRG
jgi:hypothetical protein